MRKKSQFSSLKNKRLLLALLVLAAVLVALVYAYSSRDNYSYTGPYNSPGRSTDSNNQPDTTQKQAQTPSSTSQGGTIDKNGSGVAQTPTSQWTTSESGLITLYSPTNGSALHSGDTISGSAKVSSVNYRLVDENVGVLAQGILKVVSSKYSGAIQFTPHSSSGKLVVYSLSSTGTEINRVEVKINLAE